MKSNGEGQPTAFARPTTGSSPTSFQNMSRSVLRLPDNLAPFFTRGPNETVQTETQQPSSSALPVLETNQISSVIHTTMADIGYSSDLASRAAVPQFEEVRAADNGYAMHPNFGHNPSVQIAQAQASLSMPNMYSGRLPQPEATTAALPAAPVPTVVGSAYQHQHYYPNFCYSTQTHNYPAAATAIQDSYQTNPVGVTQSIPKIAQYAHKLPPWKEAHPLDAQPVAFSRMPMESISPTNSIGGHSLLARKDTLPPNGQTYGQPIGNHPAPSLTVNTPSSGVPVSRAGVGHAMNVGDHMQTLGNGGSSVEYQKESIDVDNEANNLCGGVNKKIQDEPIDLSDDTKETPKLKKDRKKKENVSSQQSTGYRIPHKSDDAAQKLGRSATSSSQVGSNDGAKKTGFKDPLSLPKRPYTGPSVRPFSSPAPTISPIRKSPRHAKSKSRKADTELADSSKQAEPSDANVDVPLGGLGKGASELNAEIGGFRARSRSNNKRRRPNSGIEGPAKESDGTCRTEKRRNATTLDKRRKKLDTRKKKSKKQAPIKPLAKASTKEPTANEDSDDYFELIRNKKTPAIGSRRVPTQTQGDSPLSNTVGDASHSEDESVGAVGNELSSDDDDGATVKASPRQLRKSRRQVSEAITISDSPVQTQTLRKPRSPETPRTSRTPRKSKATEASRAVASRSKRKDVAHDSDDDHFGTPPEARAEKIKKKSEERKPLGNKKMKRSKTPSSPVNLVSPTPSGLERNSIRRSPCQTKGGPSSNQRGGDLDADSSDDDFDDARVSARTRGKTRRRNLANDTTTRSCPKEQRSSLRREAESENACDRIEKKDTGLDLTDEEPKALCTSPSDEDSDIAAEFPSQEQGSQPIDLKVKIVPKRKKAGPKVFLEREFLKLSTDELSIIRVAFIKRYPSPPSNMQAQGRYEAAHGTQMTSGMVQITWETQLKPWSERWWDFYLDFNNRVREKKAAKPRNKDPTLKESEVKSWVEEYYREHGDANPNVTATVTQAAANTNIEPQ